jgi:formate/nitrite transporter
MYSPFEIADNYISIGQKKVRMPVMKMLTLGIFAGMFIALASLGATAAAATIENGSLAKLISACIFPSGLAMVLIAGSELFTGNCLLLIPLLQKEVKITEVIRNLCIVYTGNFIGSMIIAALAVYGHTFSLFGNAFASSAVAIAQAKISMSFSDALIRGILCNILVCLAVWMAYSSKNTGGKIAALFFPVMLFVLLGFEHSVANMYYIPAGIMCSYEYGIAAGSLGWGSFFACNLVPVTIGNMIGGAVIGSGYWFAYLKTSKKTIK